MVPRRNSSGGAPRAVVDATEHDFGIVQPTGKCEFTFELSNAGDKPLQIHKVHKSCNCVLDKLPLRVLLPGQSAPLRVVVQLKGRQG
ncbi:MAG: DUF1573 domain-containing protein, partial [Pirellulales bacterium]|nr:DUF1573 domain-containing protein [Pirellulales bacterium]